MSQQADSKKEELSQRCNDGQIADSFYFLEKNADGYSLCRREKDGNAWKTERQQVALKSAAAGEEQQSSPGTPTLCESLFPAAVFKVKDGKTSLQEMNPSMEHLIQQGLLTTEELESSEVLLSAVESGRSVCGELFHLKDYEHEKRLVAYCIPVLQEGRAREVWVYLWRMKPTTGIPRTFVQLLTPREREVISMAAEGMTNKYIARCLQVSEGTVKKILYNGYKKLRVGSRFDVIRLLHPW